MKQPVTIAERLQATAAGETDVAQRRDLQAFLSLLLKPEELDGLEFGLWTVPGRRGHWFAANELNRAAGWALAMSRQEPVFLRPALTRRPRTEGCSNEVQAAGIAGLWLQVSAAGEDETGPPASARPDAVVALLLSRFPLKPTLVIADGQVVVLGWLFHLPWRLEEQGQRGLFEQLQQQFVFTMKAHAAAAGMATDILGEPSAGIPLPYTFCTSPAGRQAAVIQANECRYAPDDFWPHLAQEVTATHERSAAIVGNEVVRLEEATSENVCEKGRVWSEPPKAAQTCRSWLGNTAGLGRCGDLDAALPPASVGLHPCSEGNWETARTDDRRQTGQVPASHLGQKPQEHDCRGVLHARQISNFEMVEPGGGDNDRRPNRLAVSIEEIGRRILQANNGWPKRIGERLFVPGQNEFHWLTDDTALFAWLQSRGKIRWAEGLDDVDDNFVTRAELMSYLRLQAPACTAVSTYPWAPTVPGAWSGWRSPKGYAATGALLSRLLASFCPATPADASLLRAMFLTYLWGGLPGQRPLFVLTGTQPDARGIGRTQCLRTLAEVVGGAMEVSAAEPGMVRNLEANLTLPSQVHKRVVVVDEFPGVLLPQAVARWVDAEAFEGLGYDVPSFRRPNLVTWCVAARSDKDVAGGCLSDRAVVIRMATPDRESRPAWLSEVRALVREHRDEILADALATLTGGRYPISGRLTRFAAWCEEVLSTDPQVNDLLLHLGTGSSDRNA